MMREYTQAPTNHQAVPLFPSPSPSISFLLCVYVCVVCLSLPSFMRWYLFVSRVCWARPRSFDGAGLHQSLQVRALVSLHLLAA